MLSARLPASTSVRWVTTPTAARSCWRSRSRTSVPPMKTDAARRLDRARQQRGERRLAGAGAADERAGVAGRRRSGRRRAARRCRCRRRTSSARSSTSSGPWGTGAPPTGSAGTASMPRSRSTAPMPSWRSGRWRASMSTWPTNIVVTRNSVTSRAVDRSPCEDQRDADEARGGEHAVEQAAAAAGDADLDRQHGVAAVRWISAASSALRRRTWGWPSEVRMSSRAATPSSVEAAWSVHAASSSTLRSAIWGSSRRMKSHTSDAAEREQEGGRPPRDAGDDPQRAGGQHGAHRHPHAPAHQLADLPGVVVDAVEHLADGLLGQLGERLGHRGVDQVGAQLALGPVDDDAPDRAGGGVDERAADDAQGEQWSPAPRWGSRPAGRRPRCRARRRPHRPAPSPGRRRSADGVRAASRRAGGPGELRHGGGRGSVRGEARWSSRCLQARWWDRHRAPGFRRERGRTDCRTRRRPARQASQRPGRAELVARTRRTVGWAQTSNWPASRRFLTSWRNRPASAPSTRRWS